MGIDRQAYRHILDKQSPRKKDNPEGRLQLQILKYLRAVGAVAGKTKTTGIKRGNSFCFDPYLFLGYPDITFFYQNKLYFCEVKSPQGIQSPLQKQFQGLCDSARIPYILARDLEDVQKVIPV